MAQKKNSKKSINSPYAIGRFSIRVFEQHKERGEPWLGITEAEAEGLLQCNNVTPNK